MTEDIAPGGNDFFVEHGGERFAGRHLLLELWGARNLDDPAFIEAALVKAALDAKATVLHTHFHRFQSSGGVSGVAVLAESHISIHTWPEHGFAAIDIFMCGSCDPHLSINALEEAFRPDSLTHSEHKRGLRP